MKLLKLPTLRRVDQPLEYAPHEGGCASDALAQEQRRVPCPAHLNVR